MTMRRRLFLADVRGSAAAEMALMLPLLVMLLFGTFEGGNFLWTEHKAVKGVRDGARYAARHDFSDFDCTASTIDSTLETEVKNITRTGYVDGDNPNIAGSDNPSIPNWDNSEVTVSLSCPDTLTTGIYAAQTSGAPLVTVSARVPYAPLFGIIGFDTSSLHLNASAQAAVMGL